MQIIEGTENFWSTHLDFNNIYFDAPHRNEMQNQINELFKQNNFLLRNLHNIHSYNPNNITMAILFKKYGSSLILAYHEDNLYALLPQISCTATAVADVMGHRLDIRKEENFHIVTSTDALRDRAYSFAKQYPDREFIYTNDTMKPEDYIALALQGFFTNEKLHLILK